jgi:dolichyl-phosphate-mannose--protein O-mannosyl transferase
MNKGSELSAQNVSKVIVYGYLALVAIMFFFLYPAISGWIVDSDYLNYVKWLNLP